MGSMRSKFPAGYGYDLWVVYAVWIVVILLLYPLCRWFAGLKQRRGGLVVELPLSIHLSGHIHGQSLFRSETDTAPEPRPFWDRRNVIRRMYCSDQRSNAYWPNWCPST